MRTGRRQLIVLHSDDSLLLALQALAEKDYSFQRVATWPELLAIAEDAPASAIIVVDPWQGGALHVSGQLQQFAATFPSIPVVAATELHPGGSDALVTLADSGIVDLIVLGHDDTPCALAQRLQAALAKPLKALLEQFASEPTHRSNHALLEEAAETVILGGSVGDLADALGISQRTLLRWTRSTGLPSPVKLLAWIRVLLAAALLDDPGRTIYGVALAAGYGSDNSFRRSTHNLLGQSPGELRRRGAFWAAASRFRTALRDSETVT